MDEVTKLFNMEGKTIFITGGAGILGPMHAEILADAGANIVLVDVSDNLEKEVERIRKEKHCEIIGIKADISNENDVDNAVKTSIDKFGGIDVLINNAATKSEHFFEVFENFPLKDWNKVLDVNLTGMFICAKKIGSYMAEKGGGVIINVSSIYGMVSPNQNIYPQDSGINTPAIYSASKGAVFNFTRYLATYWAKKNIRVNTITFGGVYWNQNKEFVSNYSQKTPLGRMARREDYKGAILFLASDASSYMTGANLVVDGGWTCW
ncbi:SDR family oxidoreductase [Candidatus Micrarchaeota archaeon]|nr:SDR family oxidoreductase [Candidatus Micrarchaeota archaeon]